jgi:hypothetical protein
MSSLWPKFIALGIIIPLFVTSFFIYKNKKIGSVPKPQIALSTQKTNDIFADPDHDGLKNWQEDLWKTDKNNPDTDEDGTFDGKEVAENRNPLKSGSDKLFSQTAQDIAEQISAEIRTSIPILPQMKAFSNETPKVNTQIPQESPLKIYGNTLGFILINDDRQNRAYEYEIFSSLVQKTLKKEDFNGLSIIITRYGTLIQEISVVSVPNEAKKSHENLISALKNHEAVLKTMLSYEPTLNIPIDVWMSYTEVAIAVGNTYYKMAIFFKNQGIIFSASESGSIFSIPTQ